MRLIVLILVLFTFTVASNTQSPVQGTDFQLWNETVFTIPLVRSTAKDDKRTDRLSLLLITSIRLGQNRLAPTDERIGGGFDLAINKNFNFSPTYLYIAAQAVRGRSDFEHRLRFDLGYSKKFKHFSIKDRNRIEYRVRHSREDSVRYRNKLTFTVPIKDEGKEIFAPFISNEPYFDFTAKQFSRNDLSPGISKKFSEKLSADFFYVWRHNRNSTSSNIHGVGVNLKVKLR